MNDLAQRSRTTRRYTANRFTLVDERQQLVISTARSTRNRGPESDEGSYGKSRRDDVEPRRATCFTPALRLCISGCVCSTKRLSSPSSSHLNATSDPTNGRSAPAHPSGRSSALLLHPLGPRILGRFSYHLFISSRFISPSWSAPSSGCDPRTADGSRRSDKPSFVSIDSIA